MEYKSDAEKIVTSPVMRSARLTLSEIEQASELADALALDMMISSGDPKTSDQGDGLPPSALEFIKAAAEFWDLTPRFRAIMDRLYSQMASGEPLTPSQEDQEIGRRATNAQERFLALYHKVLSESDTPKKPVSICAECKQPFYPSRGGQVYHDKKCANRARMRRLRKSASEHKSGAQHGFSATEGVYSGSRVP